MLIINSATYGGVDVTNIVKSKIQNEKLIIKASNDVFGDLAPGVLKSLVVNYNDNVTVNIKENGYLKLPTISTNKLGIFYSNNNVDKVVKESLMSLEKFKDDVDILTCVWKPIFGNPFYEVIAMTQSSNHLNIVIQILQLLYIAKQSGKYKYVSFLEHDVLYPDEYFNFPDFDSGVLTNMNYKGICKNGFQQKTAMHEPLHQMTMIFNEAINHFENLLKEAIKLGQVLVEPNLNKIQWNCPNSAIHVNHGKHFTSHYTIYSKNTSDLDIYWGTAKEWINKLF